MHNVNHPKVVIFYLVTTLLILIGGWAFAMHTWFLM